MIAIMFPIEIQFTIQFTTHEHLLTNWFEQQYFGTRINTYIVPKVEVYRMAKLR